MWINAYELKMTRQTSTSWHPGVQWCAGWETITSTKWSWRVDDVKCLRTRFRLPVCFWLEHMCRLTCILVGRMGKSSFHPFGSPPEWFRSEAREKPLVSLLMEHDPSHWSTPQPHKQAWERGRGGGASKSSRNTRDTSRPRDLDLAEPWFLAPSTLSV